MDNEGFAWVNGRQLWVSEHGAGPPLLALMGIGGNTAMWRPLRNQLPGRHVIAFDMPGTGRSPLGSLRPPTMAGLAELAAGVLEACGVARADVIGYSFGGAVAQQLAHEHPDRVDRLVLAATTYGLGALPGNPLAVLSLATPLRYYSRTWLHLTAPITFGDPRPPSNRHANERTSRPPTLVGYWQQMTAIGTWSSWCWLRDLPQPTLVLMGADDRLAPLCNGRFMASRIPRARLAVVPDAGHLLLLAEDSPAYPVLRDFLDEERTVGDRGGRASESVPT